MPDRVRLRADIEFEIADGREIEVACNRIRTALDALRRTGDAGPAPTTVVVEDRTRPKPRRPRWANNRNDRDADEE